MPATSPIDIDDAVLRFTIKANGDVIKDIYPVISIRVTHEINRISFAEIVLVDGRVETGEFLISNSDDFIPGTEITITAGYGDDQEEPVFSGIVVKQKVQAFESGSFNLSVFCKHAAARMTFNRKEAQFADQTDSDVISSVIGEYGISCSVESTSVQKELLFQKLATDWDFILARAGMYGYIITTDGDKLAIGKPDFSSSPVLRLAFGESIISFQAELNAEKQAPSLEASAWSIRDQQLQKSQATEPELNEQGNLSAKKMGSQLQQSALSLNSVTPMEEDELKAWADSRLLYLRLLAIKGEVRFIGNAGVKPGDIIELEGVGERFTGKAFVSKVSHDLEQGEWTTTIRFGLDQKPIYEQADFSHPAAMGQLPSTGGLQVATVMKLSEDPASQYRIKVAVPSNAENSDGIWARFAASYATKEAGAFFLPEINDEVLIGFLENNPAYPVILGSLYSNSHTAPLEAKDDSNNTKALVTRSGLRIDFDDEKKITTIQTPAGNVILLSDDAKSIEITDQHGNNIKMDQDSIGITSKKDITMSATGNIDINATGTLNLSSKSDVSVSGNNISQDAKVSLTAKGNASAELSASGQTSVKGAIVMIN